MIDSIKRAESRTAHLEYVDQILTIRLKEGIDLNLDAVEELFKARDSIVGDERFTILVDATKKHHSTKEARKALADLSDKRIISMSIVSRSRAVRTVANFFITISRPKIPTRLFDEEEKAIEWSKKRLED